MFNLAADVRVPWEWQRLAGDPVALKFARKELRHLRAVVKGVKPRRVVVQAGGCLGVWPKYLALSFAQVITFEPDGRNFKALTQNVDEPNVTSIQAALGAEAGTIGLSRMRRDGKPWNHAGIVHVSGSGSVRLMTIDSLALPVCDLIYLDIEGYELHALKGAVATLIRCRPTVVVEVNKNLGFVGLTPGDIDHFFREHGYQFVTRYGVDHVYRPEAVM